MGYCAGSNPQLSRFEFPPTSIVASYSPWRSCLIKNNHGTRKMKGSLRACNPRGGNEIINGSRRAVIFVGSFTLPFLHLSAGALEGFSPFVPAETNLRTTELNKTELIETELIKPDHIETKEPENEEGKSQNILLSLVNEVGIFGIGVLGSLYTLAQKDKQSAEALIESLKSEISTKEGSMISLKKDTESKLVKEREKSAKQLQKSKDDQQNLLNQLSSANSNIKALGNDLTNGKVAMEGMKDQISNLNSNLSKLREIRDSLQTQIKESVKSVETLQSKVILLEKDLLFKEDDIHNLRSSADKTSLQISHLNEKLAATKDELEKAILVIETLKDDLLESNNSLASSQALADDQRSALTQLESQKAEIHQRLIALLDDHDVLKSSFTTKAAYDAELLKKTEEDLAFVEEKLRLAVTELGEKQATATNLMDELNQCKELLKLEAANMQNLREDLLTAQEAFAKEASEMKNESMEMNTKYSFLENENDTLLSQLCDSEKRINYYENEMKIKEAVTDELKSTHEQLRKASDDLKSLSREVEISAQENLNLEKELEALRENAEALSNDLEEEKATVSDMIREREELEEQSVRENEARKKLEDDVAEMKPQVASLQAENEVLLRSLAEHKSASMETLGSLEVAHNMVLRLGKERDSLQTKAAVLEEELASAKGEILRLRTQRNTHVGVDDSINVPSSSQKIARKKKTLP